MAVLLKLSDTQVLPRSTVSARLAGCGAWEDGRELRGGRVPQRAAPVAEASPAGARTPGPRRAQRRDLPHVLEVLLGGSLSPQLVPPFMVSN